jgi:hypothetical protein
MDVVVTVPDQIVVGVMMVIEFGNHVLIMLMVVIVIIVF